MNDRNRDASCGVCETRLHGVGIRETNLDGQRAVVTGANSGIGEGIVRGLAEAGAAVVVNYVANDDRAQGIVDEVKATGGRAIAIKAKVPASVPYSTA